MTVVETNLSDNKQSHRCGMLSANASILIVESQPYYKESVVAALQSLFPSNCDAKLLSTAHAQRDHAQLLACATIAEASHILEQDDSIAIIFLGAPSIDINCEQIDFIASKARGAHLVLMGELSDGAGLEPPYRSTIAAYLRYPAHAHELRSITETLLIDKSRCSERNDVQARLATAQRVSDFGHWEWYLRDSSVNWNTALATIFGLDDSEEAGASSGSSDIDNIWQRVHHEDRERVLMHMVSVQEGVGYGMLDFRIVHPSNGIRRIHQESALIAHGVQGPVLISAARDVTDRVGIEDTIRKLAYFDPLTELPNRSFLYEHLRTVLQHARRHDRTIAVVHVDLDGFKRVNGTLGHSAGDRLLQEVAVRLQGCVRDSDVVARDQGNTIWPTASVPDTVTRLGADEFIIVLSEVASISDPQRVAQRILDQLHEPVVLDGHEVTVGASIGIAAFPVHAGSEDALLSNAALAMQSAKRSGRNTYVCFDESLITSGVERLDLEADLRQALKNGGLQMYYQPKVDARTGAIEGAEALLRWNHAEIGMVPPAEFIPIAEENGLILPLGEWVIEEVCTQLAAWQRQGLQTIPVSINISVHQLYDVGLVPKIARILEATGLSPRMLEFEITESVLMEETGVAEARLHEMRALGAQVSMDDFGTGYSSLGYLKRLPIDIVKIDRSFVRDILADADDQAILAAIITMAHQLRLKIVAEGVESDEQTKLLQKMDCDLIQGFVISKPIPHEEFASRFLQGLVRFAS